MNDRERRIARLRRHMLPMAYALSSWVVAAATLVFTMIFHEGFAVLGAMYLGLVGLVTTWKAARVEHASAMGYGITSAIVAFIVMVLAVAPVGTARVASLFVLGVYLVVAAPWAARLWRDRLQAFDWWACAACGYPLVGLKSAACPECGRPFDPSRLPVVNRAASSGC